MSASPNDSATRMAAVCTRWALAAALLPLAATPLHGATRGAKQHGTQHPAVHVAARPTVSATTSRKSSLKTPAAAAAKRTAHAPSTASIRNHAPSATRTVAAREAARPAARSRRNARAAQDESPEEAVEPGRFRALAARAAASHQAGLARGKSSTKRLADRDDEEAAAPEPFHAVRPQRASAPMTSAANTAKAQGLQANGAGDDREISDRVHAWYRSHGTAPEPSGNTADAAENAAIATQGDAPRPAAKSRVSPEPDLSPVARKATLDDFDRALQHQAEAIRTAAVQNQTRTTAEDDAAEAATQIPRTAPTARVADPFTHGDLLESAAAKADAGAYAPTPATLGSDKPDAGVKKFNNRTDADALAATTSPVAGTKPVPVRIVAAQAASAPIAKIELGRPAPVVREAPAVTAVTRAAARPKLDPMTVQDLTDATFDNADADTPAAAVTKPFRPVKQTVQQDEVDMARVIPAVKVDLYDERGRLRMLPPMKGTHEILVHQNQMAVADGLDRIADDDQLADMRRLKLLVALPDNDAIQVNDPLPANRRYARPWTVRFLNDLSRAHYARFHTPLTITSAVRTVAFQRRLVLTNANAAPPSGDVASPHLYGQAIDIGKRGMSMTEIAWMRAYLTPVETVAKIDVEEEFQQACFHISVYRRYLGLPARRNTPAPDPVDARSTRLLQAKSAPEQTTRHRRLPTAILATGLR